MKVGVLGASGRMGRRVVAAVLASSDLTLAVAATRPGSEHLGADAGVLAGRPACGVAIVAAEPQVFAAVDVVIDFSLPKGTLTALRSLGGKPLVTGVTGGDRELDQALARHAVTAPLVAASNFSAGIAVLADLVRRAAAALPDFDVEVVEVHHRAKRDVPSGTALTLGGAAATGRGSTFDDVATFGRGRGARDRAPNEIGVHSVRAGGVVGEHQVWVAGPGETLVLSHSVQTRDTFADGAVRAARWVVTRPPGWYGMSDVLALSSRA